MAIKDVETKCWILALFVRDDGERFLLGDGSYEFTEKQLHFAANTMANDVVEVQGNDGYLLAGQVRRPSTQTFDGYVGDSSTSKAVVEERRRAFFAFFRKNFFYKVIYIFPDGSAIQRKRGFLVDAPEVKEIRQIYPEYHVALNFEDINYYYYDEDADGQEIYGKSATINLNSVAQSGGLIWLLPSEMTLTGEGTSFTLSVTVNGTELTSAELKGDTFQQTYSGKNLFDTSAPIVTQFGNGDLTRTVIPDGLRLTVGRAISGNPYAAAVFIIGDTSDYVGKTITFTCETVSSSTNNSRVYIGTCDSNGGSRVLKVNGSSLSSYDLSWTVEQDNNQYICIVLYATATQPVSVGDYMDYLYPQLEIGTATSYEPYVGGIASPNPDYPQEVQTATGRQVVTVSNGTQSQEYEVNLGKNLFDKNNANIIVGYIDEAHTTITSNANNRIIWIPCNPNTTYTVQKIASTVAKRQIAYTEQTPNIGVQTYGLTEIPINATSGSITTGSTAKYLVVRLWVSAQDTSTTLEDMLASVQIEKGSTATSYASYFDPIELCKIGDYQDRIYKSGSDWYLRKEIRKVIFNGSENWTFSSGSAQPYRIVLSERASHITAQTSAPDAVSNYYMPYAWDNSGTVQYGVTQSINTSYDFAFRNVDITSLADWTTWLASHNTTIYYALATPTDTQITNTALIAQLNALASATTYNGSTSFTVDGNGNLAAILAVEVEAVGGGGVEWDENGAVWEEGKPSYSIISVDSIDNVYPVLTITGRTVNPVLTDVTTGTIFQYNGTITESQVLRVDMMNKTATLNGVSVIGNVTGDWLYLAPGNNRVTYTADNADAPNATVEWQEIVG